MENLETYVFRLLIASLFGAIIGTERTLRMKDAGIRTHVSLIVAACLFTILSKTAFMPYTEGGTGDPGRIAAQIVTGVSFLCAGVIFRSKSDSLKGLSTAAGIFATAAIGMAVGAGEIELGGIVTGIIVLSQFLFHAITFGYDKYSENFITITFVSEEEIESKLKTIIKRKDVALKSSVLKKNEDGDVEKTYVLMYKYRSKLKNEVEELINHPSIKKIIIE